MPKLAALAANSHCIKGEQCCSRTGGPAWAAGSSKTMCCLRGMRLWPSSPLFGSPLALSCCPAAALAGAASSSAGGSAFLRMITKNLSVFIMWLKIITEAT